MTTRRRLVAAAAAIALAAVAVTNRGVRAAGAETARADVTMLASPRLEGRLAGTVGERNAAEYLVTRLKQIGALPLPGQPDYRLPFSFTAGTHDGGSRLRVMAAAGATLADATADARPNGARALSFSDNGDVTGAVVFAGYGIVVPESQGFSYDSYAALDVKD